MVEDSFSRALISLEGLSVGDAFGQTFFVDEDALNDRFISNHLLNPVWKFTDDTMMALSIVEVLGRCGEIDQDLLAQSFAEHYDFDRGYGPSMHKQLTAIASGQDWRNVSVNQFEGQGSFGNGSAMRSAPIGAFFSDDLDRVILETEKSSVVTHAHPEAISGAIAVAVSASIAHQCRSREFTITATELLNKVASFLPKSQVKNRILLAGELGTNASLTQAVNLLGNGARLSALDTVPFALWCVATNLQDYESALWKTVSGLGDRDTTCAIVGSILAMQTGEEGIPITWRQSREQLPVWHLPIQYRGSV